MVTKLKSVKKPVLVASLKKPRIEDDNKVEKVSSKVRKDRNSISEIASKKVKAAVVVKPASHPKPAAANSHVKVSRQPVKSKVQTLKMVQTPAKPAKKITLIKETIKPIKAQATTAAKSKKPVNKQLFKTKIKPVAQRIKKTKSEKKPVLKLKADNKSGDRKSDKIKPVVQSVTKLSKAKAQAMAAKPENKVRKLDKSKFEVKTKAGIKQQVATVAQPAAKQKAAAKSKTPIKSLKKTPVFKANNKDIAKPEKALKSAIQPPGIVRSKTLTPTKVKSGKNVTVISTAKPVQAVLPFVMVEKPKTNPEKTVVKAEKPDKKASVPQPIKATEKPEAKSQPAVEVGAVAQSTSKKADKWSDCGQVFFTAGKAYGLTPSLRTICIGNDNDVLDFFRAGTTNGRLNNQQRTVLHNIIEDRQSEGKSLDVVIPEPVVEPRRQKRTVLRKSTRGSKTAPHRPAMRSRSVVKSRPAVKSRPDLKSGPVIRKRPDVRNKPDVRSRSVVRRVQAVR